MKRTIAVLTGIIVVVSLATYSRGEQDARSAGDEFINRFSRLMKARKQEVTSEQKRALRVAHPLLLVASKDDFCRKYFWHAVNPTTDRKIEWQEAKQLILKGKIISVSQTHSLRVDLMGQDGQQYTTKESKIDEVLHVVKEVDPKMVFMSYVTE